MLSLYDQNGSIQRFDAGDQVALHQYLLIYCNAPNPYSVPDNVDYSSCCIAAGDV